MNSLSIPAEADEVHQIVDVSALKPLLAEFQGRGVSPVILGGGSNVVLADRIDAPVCLIRTRGIRAQARGDRVQVTAAAGESWHDLVRWTLGQGLAGLENLALIPGRVGAAPVQNIGAYGEELAARFVGLTVMEIATGHELRMGSDEAAFGYRTSFFKQNPGRFIITELSLMLEQARESVNTDYSDVAEELARMGRNARSHGVRPVDVAEAVVRIRRRKLPDPRRTPNAGSFFKNPVVSAEQFSELQAAHGALRSYSDPEGVKLAAAELIERCVLASSRPLKWADPTAPVRVWHRQPLVLTNPGYRGAVEVMATAADIQAAVVERFGVRLRMEPDAIGLDPLM